MGEIESDRVYKWVDKESIQVMVSDDKMEIVQWQY